jgi:carboxyl-terminal processing protease
VIRTAGVGALRTRSRVLVPIAILLAALVLPGCTILAEGSYWPLLDAPREAGSGPQGPVARAGLRPLPPLPATAAEAASRRASLQVAITRRWSSEDLARSARAMDGLAGRLVYADAMQAVVWFYVDPITYRHLVVAGIESLRAALDNADFRRRFPEADDLERRGRLARTLEILDLKARAADPALALQAADWLAAALEKNRAMLGLPDGAVVAEFLFGAMDALDPYSKYMTPEMFRVYQEQTAGAYVGIGIEISRNEGRFFISEVFEGGGAEAAGLEAGDEIVAVEQTLVAGWSLGEFGRRVRGQADTPVTLSIRTGGQGQPHDVAVRRGRLQLPAVRGAQMLDETRGIAYLRLAEFQGGSAEEVRRAVESLAAEGAKALILDLRNNPGGLLDEAVSVVGVFVAGGPVLETRGRMIGAVWKYDVPLFDRPAWTGPLAVLTNGDSASASEVVASALEERGRATVVGQRTYGKGAAQICFPIPWGDSAVYITISRVFDVEGRCLDGRGVAPNRVVPAGPALPPSLAEDPVVHAAVAAIEPTAP